MLKKIIICVAICISTTLFSMEMEKVSSKKFIPFELRERIILFLAGGLKEIDLDQAIMLIKDKIKEDNDLKKDLLFNKNLIEILCKKFKNFRNEKEQLLYIASKLGTDASIKIVNDEYKQNPEELISIIVSLFNPSKSSYGKELLNFAHNNFELKDIKKILMHRNHNQLTALAFAVISGNSELVELFLDLVNQHLNAEEKKILINQCWAFGQTALFWGYHCQLVQMENNANWQVDRQKIIDLLVKNGAEETITVKHEKECIRYQMENFKASTKI